MIKKNDLPPLNSLIVFVAVVKTKNYTKAADKLYMTHSAVSQSIKKLELYLDKKLFLTDKKKVIITKAAKDYYQHINPLINEIHEVTKAFKLEASPKLSLNCMTTLSANWLIPKFDKLIDTLKDTTVQLVTLGRSVDFSIDDIDLSIEYGAKEDFNNANSYKLANGELVLVCHSRHKNKTCSEIIKQNSLIYVDDKLRSNDHKEWFTYNNIKTHPKKNIVFKTSIQAIQACISGIGFFITEKLLIEEHVKNGLLYIPQQKSYPTGKAYYLLSKEYQSSDFLGIKNLLSSYLD